MPKAWVEDTWRANGAKPRPRQGQGNRWKAYWHEPDPNGLTPPKRRVKRFRTKVEAEQFLTAVAHAQRTNTYVSQDSAAVTFAEAAQEWLATHLALKDSTRFRYARDLANYVLPRWGGRTLTSITKREAQLWIADLAAGTAPAAYAVRPNGLPAPPAVGAMRGPLSPNSIRHLVHILTAVMRWAVDAGLTPVNPCRDMRIPRAVDHEHVYLSHAEVEALAASAFDVTARELDRVLIYLLAYTGLRINEALALTVGSIDVGKARIEVRQAWSVDADGKPSMSTPKSHKRRRVGIPRFLLDMLVPLLTGREPDEFVFTTVRGAPVNAHNWRMRVFNLARDTAGIDRRLVPHGLRHTAASMAIAAGADVKLVQHMLGHADATETLNTYGHLWRDRINEVSDALDSARSAALAASTHDEADAA